MAFDWNQFVHLFVVFVVFFERIVFVDYQNVIHFHDELNDLVKKVEYQFFLDDILKEKFDFFQERVFHVLVLVVVVEEKLNAHLVVKKEVVVVNSFEELKLLLKLKVEEDNKFVVDLVVVGIVVDCDLVEGVLLMEVCKKQEEEQGSYLEEVDRFELEWDEVKEESNSVVDSVAVVIGTVAVIEVDIVVDNLFVIVIEFVDSNLLLLKLKLL